MVYGVSGNAASGCKTGRAATPAEGPIHQAKATALPAIRVVDTQITVPRDLQVSEANTYYPMGDIVWRGAPYGDRHAQMDALLHDSMSLALRGHAGSQPAVVEITLRRFHAMTEKTRYSVGGVHSIRFDLTLRDPATEQALLPTRTIRADLKGYGGDRALAAERAGLTQKVRVTYHLANTLRAELERPGSMGGNRGVTLLVAGLESAAPI
ncbi:MAG: DUF6778 family protein [Rhodobacterales bacterium]